jgi:multimeric flavodoxin WrbA
MGVIFNKRQALLVVSIDLRGIGILADPKKKREGVLDMQVLGLSGGRRHGNSEMLVREALMGAEERGATVELIRLMDLDIKAPLGVGSQDKRADHTSFLARKMTEADGIIFGAPSYSLTPPGYTVNIRDRVSLRHGPGPKPQVGALIGVGGTDWVQLLLPMMYLFLPQGQCKLVDQMLVTYVVHTGQALLDKDTVARARKLGSNVVEALKTPFDQVAYVGDDEGVCPICHQDLLRVRGKFVECPICDIRGRIEATGDGIKVTFTEEALKTYHWGQQGLQRHTEGIQSSNPIYKQGKAAIQEMVKKHEEHLAATLPPGVEAPPPVPDPEDR